MATKKFIITGFGRSGTKFLSTVMNQSKKWEVLHEPRGALDELHKSSYKYFKENIKSTFKDAEYYGEVNSYLRFHYKDIKVDKKGILLRNPYKVFLSVMNRKNYIDKYVDFANQIDFWYNDFYNTLKYNEKIIPIIFEKITTNTHYLEETLNEFNIYEVNITEDTIIKKINTNKTVKFEKFSDLPLNVQNYAAEKLKKHENIINQF